MRYGLKKTMIMKMQLTNMEHVEVMLLRVVGIRVIDCGIKQIIIEFLGVIEVCYVKIIDEIVQHVNNIQ